VELTLHFVTGLTQDCKHGDWRGDHGPFFLFFFEQGTMVLVLDYYTLVTIWKG